MKKLMIVLTVIVLAIVVIVAVIASKSGTIIQQAVVRGGPEVTGSAVGLDSANVSWMGGAASLEGLVIGNPQGFKSDYAFKVDKTALKLDVNSLFSDVIHIKEIMIDGAALNYEMGKGGSNIDALQREIEKRTAAMMGTPAEEEAPAKKVIIDHVYINGTQVNLKLAALGGKGAGLTLPDLHLQDIGKKSGGATAAEAAQQVFAEITKAVTKLMSSSQVKGLIGTGGNLLEGAGEGAGDALEGGIDKVGKGLGGALKGVFK